jgi:acyl-CoA reductase-like NAD-dependent aldehyde dehydrogenase
MRDQQLFLNGRWVPGVDTFEVRDPFDQSLVGTVAVASPEQAAEAVSAARAAMLLDWPAASRADVLLKTSQLVAERSADFAEVLRAEAGKPISAALVEVSRAVGTLRIASEEARRLPSETVQFDEVSPGVTPLGFTIPKPFGVVAAITPFNFPLNLVLHKVAPALAAGCAVVLKPSERTPLSAGLLAETLVEAGLPPGWLNVITGQPQEIVPIWNNHRDVAVITFTGSAEVGWKLKAASPRKRHVLELGSNTAMVVAADADLNRAVNAVTLGGYTFSGQACVSVQRVYVEEPVATEFTAMLAAAVEKLPVGDTKDPATVVGPVISEQARERLVAWIGEAVQGGARIATGGTMDGTCLRPTVLADVPATARVVCEEVFGPVVSIRTVKSVAEGIEEVNSARYGLNTAIFTSDLASALQFAREAEAGSVLVNITPAFRADHMPYGGVKDSGQGREGVKYAIAELLDQRLVVLAP